MKKTVFFLIVMIVCGWYGEPLASKVPVLDDNPKRDAATTTKKVRIRSLATKTTTAKKATAKKVTAKRTARVATAKVKPVRQKKNRSYQADILKKITSKSVIIIDGENGVTLFAKNPDLPRQPASTIKVLTGMIAIKSLAKNEMVDVSRYAALMPSSKVYLSPEKKYKANDLINAVLLSSANDASVALAEKIAGSEQRFARLMTSRAKLWGAQKTVCQTATGLTARGQQSTARDLALIFRHAMKDQEFAQRMHKVQVRTADGKTLRNHNKALWSLDGALAGKTGFTQAAGQTYVGKFSRNGESIIVAVMGSQTMWNDVKHLVDYGFGKQRAQLASGAKRKLASNR